LGGVAVGVIDYGAGNLRSIARAIEVAGARPVVLRGPAPDHFDVIILPGVGAFGAAMRRLDEAGMPAWIRARVASGTPLIGVCLGMQLLYEQSEESPGVAGLRVLAGAVRRLPAGRKVPHMGWNSLRVVRPSRIVEGIGMDPYVYFVHSYVVEPTDSGGVVATASYGVDFPAVVQDGPVIGLQFHPEKSGAPGLRLLRNVLAAAGTSSAATSPAAPAR
jgi:glutamine amidotransferase